MTAYERIDPITPVLMGQDIVPDAQVAITITLAVYQAAIKSDLGDLRGQPNARKPRNSGLAARESLLEAIPAARIWPEMAVHLGNAG